MVVDFPDGYMRRNLADSQVQWIDFNSVKFYPGESLVICQLLAPWNIPDLSKFPKGTKFLFWGLHPQNLFPFFLDDTKPGKLRAIVSILLKPFAIFRWIKLRRFLRALIKKHSVVYMDMENYRTNRMYFDIDSKPCLVPALVPRRVVSLPKKTSSTIRIVWVGRLVDFKVHILIHLMTRLSELNPGKYRITLDILGSGDAYHSVEKIAKGVAYEVNMVGELSNEDIFTYLEENADLVFAMGQSAVEAASLRIPSILVDFSKKTINRLYKFKWIYERVDYSVGEQISSTHYETISSLESLFRALLIEKERVSIQCYEYWKNNYSEEIFLNKFLQSVTLSCFTIGDIFSMKLNKPDLLSCLIKRLQIMIKGDVDKNAHQFKRL
jgi:hypothetical protein